MLARLLSSQSASSAAEFALVLPAALLMLFGVIDVGMYAWQINEYEKATQMGARFAVVTDVVSDALANEDLTFVGDNTCGGGSLVAGQRICAAALGTIECTSSVCTLEGNFPGDWDDTVDEEAFGRLVARMRSFEPRIDPGDVRVVYRGSGLGFAGDPHKPEVAPLVTVRVAQASYSPIVLSPFGGTVPLPDFSYSLTLEDGEGTQSS
ncbi:MAG TPA: TadE/TadG family type IV pilus assembly protein [Croceibacterium sp.]|nr:TadE/TadG family type IV pilus assembly protein [Croceibacterium sp.]